MTARFVVTVLLGSLLLPGPADFASLGGVPQRCAAFCRDGGGKFDYTPDQKYVYDYRADTISSVSGVGTDESRLHLSATVVIWPQSKCDFLMQLHNVLLEESSPGNVSQRSPDPDLNIFSSYLEQDPFKFSFQDGKVEDLCTRAEDLPWASNIKRGILSVFQNSMDDFGQKATVLETDVTGTCDTEYLASPVDTYPVVVTKVKDLTSCDHHHRGSHSMPSVSYNRGRGLPFVKSEQKCEQRINEDKVLEKSICEEIHLFRPFSNSDNGAVTKVLQMLTLRKVVRTSDKLSAASVFPSKTNMLYQQTEAQYTEDNRVMSLLKHLESSTRQGVDVTTPEIFSQLVAALEVTRYPQLAKIFSLVHNPVQRKFLVDAMPYVRTADGMTVVTDLFRSGELTSGELDSWLTSLSFQKNPTLDMLTAVSPLLDSKPRQKAVLGVTSMVHSYCQVDPECQERQMVRDLASKVEKLLGSDCRADSMEDLMVALKGIGNMGLVTSGEVLSKCHQRGGERVEVRLAAIAATRRMSCQAEQQQQQQLLRIFSDAAEDVEVRIAAYQSVMRCPSYDTLALVKNLLSKEEINQVGSYVWTHLTNLRGTRSRWKQGIKELLLDDFLQKKFSTDARKFSRNYELSALLGSPEVRASAEADVIFTPASFLPRSVALNLTVDLFGESLNLLELGARAEGFEGLLEDLLGPGKKSFRKDEGVETDLSKMKAAFETRRKLGGEPRGSLYARVMGNEVSYLRFQDVLSAFPPPLRQGLRYNKTFSLGHASYVIPTACGFSLEFSVNGSAAVNLEVRGDVRAVNSTSLTAEGRLAPSAALEVVGTMAVTAFRAKAGVVSVTRLHTNSYVDGVLRVEGGRLVDVRVNTPRKRSDVLEASSRLFLLHREARLPLEGDADDVEEARGCSSEGLSRALGMQLCTELAYPKPEAPTFPLGGPAVLKVVLFKTDTFDSYQFRYALRNDRHVKQLLVAFDTPGSSVDRKLRAALEYDAKKTSLEADVRSPAFRMRAEGKVSDGTVLASLELDGEELLALNAGVASAAGPQTLLQPRVYLALRKTHVLLDAVARVLHVEGSRYKATLEVNGLLGSSRKVLDVSADLTMDRCAYTVAGAFHSPRLEGNFEGAYRSERGSVSSHARVEYSDRDRGGPPEVLEVVAKLKAVQNVDSVTRSLQFHMQVPNLEEYNTKVRWQLEYGDKLLDHRALLTVGDTSWETAQEFRCRASPEGYLDFRLMAMLLGGSQDLDYKFDAKLQTTKTGLETYLVAHRSSRRRYTALLQYKALQELQLRLALPDLEFHLDSSCTQEHQDIALRADTSITYVTLEGVRRRHDASLRGLYTAPTPGKGHEVRVSLYGIVAAQLTGTFGVGTDGVVTQTAVVETSGLRYAQRLTYRYHRGHLLALTLETPARNYTGDISSSWSEEEKSLAVDLQLSKRFTFSTKVRNTETEDSAELELLWDSISDPLNSVTVQLKSVDEEHGLLVRYRGRHVTANLSTPPRGVSARVSWGDADANETVSLDADWTGAEGVTAVSAVLKTPFEGLEAQDVTYAFRRPDADSGAIELKFRWHEGRDSASLTATGVSDQLGLEASVAFRSTLASLDDVSLHVTHRRSSVAVTDGAELLLGGRRFTADMRWHADAGGVAANLTFGDVATPERRIFASLDYSGSSGRLELTRGAERRFLSAYSVGPGSVSASLATPVPWLRRVEASGRYVRDGAAVDAALGGALNQHEVSVDVKASDVEEHFNCSAVLTSTFTDAATLTLVHGRRPGALLEDLLVTLDDVSVATLRLQGTTSSLDARATVPGHSVATSLRAGDGKAEGQVRWNDDVASLELEGRPGHYEAALASSRLPRELRFVFDHRRDADVCETLVAFAGRFSLHHKLQLRRDGSGWDHDAHVTTPAGDAWLSNSLVAEERRLLFNSRLQFDGRVASCGVAVDRDFAGTVERASADVATPWADPASLSYVRVAVLEHELVLRYRRDRQVKATASMTEDSVTLRLEAPRMRPLQLLVVGGVGGGTLRLEWEDKALEASLALASPRSHVGTLSLKVSRSDLEDELLWFWLSRQLGVVEAELRCPGLEASGAANVSSAGVEVKASAATQIPALELLVLEGSWQPDWRAVAVALTRNRDRFQASSRALWSQDIGDVSLDLNTNTDLFDNVTLGGGWEDGRAAAYFVSRESWRLNVTWASEALGARLETPLPGARVASAALRREGGGEVRALLHVDEWRLDLRANRTDLEVRLCDHRLAVSGAFEPGAAHVSFVLDEHDVDVSASVGDLTGEVVLRSASLGIRDALRAKVTLEEGRRRSVGVSVTNGKAPVLDLFVYNDRDADGGLRLVAPSVDAGASFSLRGWAPKMALHLSLGDLNNTVAVVVDVAEESKGSVAAFVSLPSWNVTRYEVRAGFDASAMPKALSLRLTRDATTPFSLDYTMKRNSVNAFLKSDVLKSLVWTLKGNFNFDQPKKYMDVVLDGHYGGPVHLDAKTSFTEYASEVELDLRTTLKDWETLKIHGLYDSSRSQTTAKMVVVKDASNVDVSVAAKLTPDSGFAGVNVTGTHLDLTRLSVSYDLEGKVSADVTLLRNNRDHQVTGSFLADDSRLLLFLETPSPLLRTLNLSSNYDDGRLSLELLYLGLGVGAEPFHLLVRWDDGDIRIQADRMGNVHNLEAKFQYTSLTNSLFALSMTARDRKALNIKFGILLNTIQKIVANLQVDSQIFNLDSFDLSLVCDSKRPLEDIHVSVKNEWGTVFGWKSNVTREDSGHLGVHTQLDVGTVRHVGDLACRVGSDSLSASASWKSSRFGGEYGGRIAYERGGRELEAGLTSPSDHLAVGWRLDGSSLQATLETPFEGLEKLAAKGNLLTLGETGKQLSAYFSVNERPKLELVSTYQWNPQLKNVTLSLGNGFKMRCVLATVGARADASLELWTPLETLSSVKAVVALEDTEALVTADVDGQQKVFLHYRVRQSESKGDLTVVFRSFASPNPLGVSLKYDVADDRSSYVAEGNVDCFGSSVKASLVANQKLDGNNHGAAVLSVRTPGVGKVVDLTWNLKEETLEVVVRVDGDDAATLRTVSQDHVLTRVATSVTLDNFHLDIGWNGAKEAVNSSATLLWDGREEFHVEGGVKFPTRDQPLSLSFRLTSPLARFRRISLTSDVTTSPDLRAKALVHWNHDSPIVDLSTFVKRTKLKMTSSLQVNVRNKNVLLGAAYDLNAPTKLVSLKLVDGSKQYALRTRFSPNSYEHPEVSVVVVAPLAKVDAAFQYDVRQEPSTASLSLRVGETLNSVNASLRRAPQVSSVHVSAALPSVLRDSWSLATSLESGAGLGLRGVVARDAERYLAATLQVLPRFLWLEVVTPFSGFENLTAETVLLGGDSVQVARVAARWGRDDALELRVGSTALDDRSVSVDVQLASPWTGNVTILGTYHHSDEHRVRLKVLRGESEDLVAGNLVLNVQNKKFSFEMSCTVEDLGSTALDVGYDISQPSKKVYFNGSLDRYTFVAVAEGGVDQDNVSGFFRLQTPFAVVGLLETRLSVVLNLRDGRPSVVQVKRNSDLYEAHFSGTEDRLDAHVSVCARSSCSKLVSFHAELTDETAELEVGYSDKTIKLEGFRAVSPGAVILRGSVATPFRGALQDASLDVVVHPRRPGGKLVVAWNSLKRVEVSGQLRPDDVVVTLRTAFPRLDTFNVTWRLAEGRDKSLLLNASVALNDHSVSLGAAAGPRELRAEARLDGQSKASLVAKLALQPTALDGVVALTSGSKFFVCTADVAWHAASSSLRGKLSLQTSSPSFPSLDASLNATLGRGEAKASLEMLVAVAPGAVGQARLEHHRGPTQEAAFAVDVVAPRLAFHAAGHVGAETLRLDLQSPLYNVSAETRRMSDSGVSGRFSLSGGGADAQVSVTVVSPAEGAAAVRLNENRWSSSYSVGGDALAAKLDVAAPALRLAGTSLEVAWTRTADGHSGEVLGAVGETMARARTTLSRARGKMEASVGVFVAGTPFATQLLRDAHGASARWVVDADGKRVLHVEFGREDGVATLRGLVDADLTGRHDGALSYSDALDHVTLRLDDLLDAQINVTRDAGVVVVKSVAATHQFLYKVLEEDLSLEMRSSGGGGGDVRAALRLRGSEMAAEVLRDAQVLLALGASARVDDAEVRAEVSLELLGSQSSVVLRHRRVFPLASEVNLMSSRLPGKVVRALLSADHDAVVAFVGHGDSALLEATLRRGGDDLQLLLRTPALQLTARVDAADVEATLEAEKLSAWLRLSPASFSSRLSLAGVEWRCDVPLAASETLRLNVTLAYAGQRHSVHASVDQLPQVFGVAAGFQIDALEADARLRLDYENTSLTASVSTPWRRVALQLNPAVGKSVNYVEWNDARVQLSYATLLRQRRFLVDVELTTPFRDLDRYALRLEYENDARKALVALAQLPGSVDAVGVEVDCLLEDLRDLSLRTSLAPPKFSGIPPVGLAVRNKISADDDSVSSVATLDFPAWRLGLEVVGHVNASGLEASLRGHVNDHQLHLSATRAPGKPSWLRLQTPFGVARNLSVGYALGPSLTFLDVNYDSREVLYLQLLASALVPALYRLPHLETPLLLLRTRWLSAACLSRSLDGDQLRAWVAWTDAYRWDVDVSSSAESSLALRTSVRTPTRRVGLETVVSDRRRVFLITSAPDLALGLATLSNETHSVVRVDLLSRAVEAVWRLDPRGGAATLFWDAAGDRNNKLGVEVTFPSEAERALVVDLQLSPLRRIVLEVQAQLTDNHREYSRILMLDVAYGLHTDERLRLGFKVQVQEGGRLEAEFLVTAPALRVYLEAKVSSVAFSSGDLRVTYVDPRTDALRPLGVSYLLERRGGEARLSLQTPDNGLHLRGRLRAHELALEAGTNHRTPTLLLAELHPERLHAQVTVRRDARGASLFVAAPHWRRVSAGAFALVDGARTRETSVVAALNTTRLLWTRVLWHEATLQFLGRELVQELEDASHVLEELAYELTDLLRQDVVGRLAQAFPSLGGAFRRLRDAASQELRLLCQDVLRDAAHLRDHFYLKTLVEAAVSATWSARDTLSVVLEECREMWTTVKIVATKFFSVVVEGIAADEFVSHLQEWFDASQEIASMAAGNAIRLAEEMRSLQVKTRRVIKAAVGTIRHQLSTFKENTADSLRKLELEVYDLLQGVLQVLDPIISQVQEYLDNVRRASEMVSDKVNGLLSQFTTAMLEVEEVVYFMESYSKLKAWVKEINMKDLADLLVKIVADSVESIVKDVMQTVDNFVVFVGGVSNASPRQAVSVAFIRKTINTIYQKVSWLWERYDVSGFVADSAKVVLEELDDVLAELEEPGLADALGAHVLLRPNADGGVLEYSQRLPVEWKAFNQLPNLEELELQRKPVVVRLKDNIESYVVSSYKELTRNRSLAELLPPFPKQAVVVRGRHLVTFDGQYLALPPGLDGHFLLATDFLRDQFLAYVTLHGQRSSLSLLAGDAAVTLGPGASLTVEGPPPQRALASERRLSVETASGVSVECDALGAVCVLQLSGWFFGRSAGLLGTPDNEPSDDLALPPEAWRLSSLSPSPSWPPTPREEPAVPASLCGEFFGRQGSPLSPCFASVDPAPFRRLCDHVAVCDASAAYVGVCRKAGVDLGVPSDCVRCESRDGFLLQAGASQVHVGDEPPTSADVVLLAAAAPDNVTALVTRLDAALAAHGVSSSRYALVGLDGALRTTGGRVWVAHQDLSLSTDAAAPSSTPSDALSDLLFRDGAAKMALLVGGDASSFDHAAVEELRRRGVALGQLTDASVDATAEGVAAPPGCQRCQCVADHDGVGRLECQGCRAEISRPPVGVEEFFDGVDYFPEEDEEDSLIRELLSS